jgi:NAD(P)-dependent dehydrogenase (short-subunit alcohol dehydrogenase family)
MTSSLTSPYVVTPQVSIGSGFDSHSTAKDVLAGCDLHGVVAIVTGGYSGVGLEITRALAEAGATVVVPARTPAKARAATTGIPHVELEQLELSDPVSIDSFASRYLATNRPLQILINNAGIMAPPLTRDARGYESQFAVNHLGHFQLTARLWPMLKRAGHARVVSVSSTGIRFGGVIFDDPNFEGHPYDKWRAYGQSKTANALFAVALDRHGQPDGVRAFAVHPGRVLTDLARFLDEKELATGGYSSAEQGAATSVWCATSAQLDGKGGVFCMNVDIAPVMTHFSLSGTSQILTGVLPWAINPELATRLWHLSEQLTGVAFPD